MSQHDFNIANQGFPAFRADLNSGLEALATNSSGSTQPSTTFAYQFWYDEANDLLKMRNSDNDAWITLASFDQATDEWEVRSAVVQAVDAAGLSIKTDDGTTRFSVDDSGQVSFENYSFPIADGSANQVLQTDGAGTLVFDDPPAGYTDSDALDLFNATGSAPVYACRAWVKFDGPSTIQESGNVSSITSLSTGNYRINFSSALTDANFCVTTSIRNVSTSGRALCTTQGFTTSFVDIRTLRSDTASQENGGNVSVAVFR